MRRTLLWPDCTLSMHSGFMPVARQWPMGLNSGNLKPSLSPMGHRSRTKHDQRARFLTSSLTDRRRDTPRGTQSVAVIASLSPGRFASVAMVEQSHTINKDTKSLRNGRTVSPIVPLARFPHKGLNLEVQTMSFDTLPPHLAVRNTLGGKQVSSVTFECAQ